MCTVVSPQENVLASNTRQKKGLIIEYEMKDRRNSMRRINKHSSLVVKTFESDVLEDSRIVNADSMERYLEERLEAAGETFM